jgi:hypothetical protein
MFSLAARLEMWLMRVRPRPINIFGAARLANCEGVEKNKTGELKFETTSKSTRSQPLARTTHSPVYFLYESVIVL